MFSAPMMVKSISCRLRKIVYDFCTRQVRNDSARLRLVSLSFPTSSRAEIDNFPCRQETFISLQSKYRMFFHNMTYKLMTMTISAILTIYIYFSYHSFYSTQHDISFQFMTIRQQCIIYYLLLMTENRHRHLVDSS